MMVTATEGKENMNGYGNAPHIEPKVGDVVAWHTGENVVVASVDLREDGPRPWFTNCLFNGALHLHRPSEMVLVKSVDGFEPAVSEREEHVKCVLLGTKDEPRITWCGRTIDQFEWAFLDASHSALNGRSRGRLTACPSCAAEIIKALSP